MAGIFALAAAGNALAGQGEAFFTSFANPPSSGARTASARLLKTTTNEKVAETRGSTDFHIPAASSLGQISSDTSTRYSREEHFYPPTADLFITGRNSDNENQTFSGLSPERGHSFFGGSPGGEFAGGHDGHTNQDTSDTFSRHFENDHDFSNHMDDSTKYFNCSVIAVPETDTWLMMLCGLGLTGFFATLRKRNARISDSWHSGIATN